MGEYHTHVDIDGDGHWDHVSYAENPDGSVTITGDANHDGQVDFRALDHNADGIIESATYDNNFDGTMDTGWTDSDGDGYLDAHSPIHHTDPGSGAQDSPVPTGEEFTLGGDTHNQPPLHSDIDATPDTVAHADIEPTDMSVHDTATDPPGGTTSGEGGSGEPLHAGQVWEDPGSPPGTAPVHDSVIANWDTDRHGPPPHKIPTPSVDVG
ncbi:MAG TPA: hypothetical protein VHU91_00115 [Mycobacteriales bacterium]|jgi:hypothetical protein|nr:hypothetical protein [Mycobacteriales bacterium]